MDDPNEEYLVWQTLVGAWPIVPSRLEQYLEKALREAKRNTNWLDPDERTRRASARSSASLYENRAFLDDFEPFVRRDAAGEHASLGALLLRLTSPGLPDIYQGDAFWSLNLVDPDNRRPVDWSRHYRARTRGLADTRDEEVPSDPPRPASARRASGGVLRLVRAARPRPRPGRFVRGGRIRVVVPLRPHEHAGGDGRPPAGIPPGSVASALNPHTVDHELRRLALSRLAARALPRIEDLPIADRATTRRRCGSRSTRSTAMRRSSTRRSGRSRPSRSSAATPTRCATTCGPCARSDSAAARRASRPGRRSRTSARRPEIPGVVFRLAAETALLVAVAVIAGVAQFRGWVIVALMALAFVVVALSEWFAARARFVPPAVAFLPPLDDAGEPAPYVEAPAPPLGRAALEPAEDTEPDALTMIEQRSAEAEDEARPAADPWEHAAVEDERAGRRPERAELAERGGIFSGGAAAADRVEDLLRRPALHAVRARLHRRVRGSAARRRHRRLRPARARARARQTT